MDAEKRSQVNRTNFDETGWNCQFLSDTSDGEDLSKQLIRELNLSHSSPSLTAKQASSALKMLTPRQPAEADGKASQALTV